MSVSEVLVEVVRGPAVESRHRGIVAVSDASGRLVFALGDTARTVYPRSAIKALQALGLVESGAAAAFGFGDRELALACSSHSGEPMHVETARGMLERAGLGPEALECGTHWPTRADAAYELARSGAAPNALHNNCSGKHSGFLAYARHRGYACEGYIGYDHPVQTDIRATLEELFATALTPDVCGTDGCSIPTYATPLDKLATAFARFATGTGLSPDRAAAAARLRAACAAAPEMVAGTGRYCTDLMRFFGARVFAKTGAEGVFCAALPGQGLGIALKCDDGASRAAEIMLSAVIERFLPMSNEERVGFRRFLSPDIRNWNGIRTGEMRPSEHLRTALGI